MEAFQRGAALLRRSEVGRGATIDTPFGPRLLSYADLTATGRMLEIVESYLDRVRPYYANTHTAVSTTGRIMSRLREDARRAVARSVHAAPSDVVLFCGSGATAAVNKLVGLLGLRIPEPLEREHALASHVPQASRPVVLVGPYEHHSNELPWLESIADVVEVGLDPDGRVDLADLAAKARACEGRPLRIGAFSAGSNVTGVLTDVPAVARVLHRHGAYACIDYAAAGPYVPIDMHPSDPAERLDAIFVSPHKFMGGPESSGVLVATKDLFRSATPERPGGGTVDYVAAFDRVSVDYARDLTEREEGGTPAIIGDVRAGLAFVVKDWIGADQILAHEVKLAGAAFERLARHPRIRLYGPRGVDKLGILSFNVEGLHHDLVSALLDHLFGIQNRAGCSCAGPYGHRLLGIDRPRSERYRRMIAEGLLGIKPGWVRISLPYYASDADIEFVLRAIEFVADRGDAFVPAYRLGWRDGVWRHLEHDTSDLTPFALDIESLLSAEKLAAPAPMPTEEAMSTERARYFDEAARIAGELDARWAKDPPRYNRPTGRPDVDALVWFRYVHTDVL